MMFDALPLERQRTESLGRLLADTMDRAQAAEVKAADLRAGLEQALVSLRALTEADFREGRLTTIIHALEQALLTQGKDV